MPPQSGPPISLLGAQVLKGTVDRFAFMRPRDEDADDSREIIFVFSSEYIEDTEKQWVFIEQFVSLDNCYFVILFNFSHKCGIAIVVDGFTIEDNPSRR